MMQWTVDASQDARPMAYPWMLAIDSSKCAVGLVFPISVAEVIMARKRFMGRFRCPTSGWSPHP
jgi:hypothetical protein